MKRRRGKKKRKKSVIIIKKNSLYRFSFKKINKNLNQSWSTCFFPLPPCIYFRCNFPIKKKKKTSNSLGMSNSFFFLSFIIYEKENKKKYTLIKFGRENWDILCVYYPLYLPPWIFNSWGKKEKLLILVPRQNGGAALLTCLIQQVQKKIFFKITKNYFQLLFSNYYYL